MWDVLLGNVLLWTPSCRHANVRQPTRTYLQQLCMDTRCNGEDQPEVMDNRNKWEERVREIFACSTT